MRRRRSSGFEQRSSHPNARRLAPGDIDADLIAAAARGERDAIDALFSAFQPLLLRYLRGMGGRAADDVAAQVWLEVVRSLGRFDGDGVDFRRFLFTIGRRRMIDNFRRLERVPEDPTADAGPGEAVEPGDPTDHEWVLAQVRQLPPAQADVVLLRVVAELDLATIATLTDRSPGAVRVLLHRGLARLRERLEPQVSDEFEPAVTPTPAPTMNPTS